MIVNEVGIDAKPEPRKIIVITRLMKDYGKPVIHHVEFMPEIEANESYEGPNDWKNYGSKAYNERAYAERVCEKAKDEMCKQFIEFSHVQWMFHITNILDPAPVLE